jgi:uracil-DNA glycosylase
MTLSSQEQQQIAKIRQAKLEILFTTKDEDNNLLVFNMGRLYLRQNNEDRNRNLGSIYTYEDKIIYSKWETQTNIFKKMDAWSIPVIIAFNVDIILIKTPERNYWIRQSTIKDLLKSKVAAIMKFEGMEKKVYIPRSEWAATLITDDYRMSLIAGFTPPKPEGTMNKYANRVGEEWATVLFDTFETPYMQSLGEKLGIARTTKTIYPESQNVFRAFRETPYTNIKAVLIGQDPYHDGNATGLCFDCGIKLTPSADKIIEGYNEQFPSNFAVDILEGHFERWAREGVFMLNTALTVEKGNAGSHLSHWLPFTQEIIKLLNRRVQSPYNMKPIVYILWGKHAQSIRGLVSSENPIVETEHPAAAIYEGRKWKHNNCFIEVNTQLKRLGVEEIDW